MEAEGRIDIIILWYCMPSAHVDVDRHLKEFFSFRILIYKLIMKSSRKFHVENLFRLTSCNAPNKWATIIEQKIKNVNINKNESFFYQLFYLESVHCRKRFLTFFIRISLPSYGGRYLVALVSRDQSGSRYVTPVRGWLQLERFCQKIQEPFSTINWLHE